METAGSESDRNQSENTSDGTADSQSKVALDAEQTSLSTSDIIRRRFEKKIAESAAGSQSSRLSTGAGTNLGGTGSAERPRSAFVTTNERLACTQNDKATARTGSGDQSTEGVHPNALRDPQNCCVVCGKRVYQLEKVAAHKGVYHKSCFRCEVCETTLGPGNFSVLDGHLFCKPHLIQQFKTRGKYETSAAFKAREASASGYRAGAAQNGNAAVK